MYARKTYVYYNVICCLDTRHWDMWESVKLTS